MKTSKNKTMAWAWQKPDGSFYKDAFPSRTELVSFYGASEYKGSPSRVLLVPYKKKK